MTPGQDLGEEQSDGGPRRPPVLHLTGDFPDPFEPFKTPVIRELLALTRDRFDHSVISINRVSPTAAGAMRSLLGGDRLATERQSFEHGIALRYVAPGKGLRHRTKLIQLGRLIADEIAAMPRKPALLVGHKLTIEGIAIAEASRLSGIPYALSIQGNTDLKILASRPDLKGVLGKIFHGAQVVFPFAPWALAGVEKALGKRQRPTLLLPCPTELDSPAAPQPDGDGLVSVFHLKNYANKNLAGIVAAYRMIEQAGDTPPPLEVIGGGSDEELAACRELAKDFEQITFAGPMDREPLRERLNRASAMVMPSFRESFGLVFIEALFAGCPIVYPEGTSVDGYFDGASFALGVDPRAPVSIASAIRHAMAEETEMKQALTSWQASPEALRFTRPEIARRFGEGLDQAMRRM